MRKITLILIRAYTQHWPILYKPAFDAVSIFRIYEEVPLALLYAMYALSARLAPTPGLGAAIAESFRHVAEEELQTEGAFRSDSKSSFTNDIPLYTYRKLCS